MIDKHIINRAKKNLSMRRDRISEICGLNSPIRKDFPLLAIQKGLVEYEVKAWLERELSKAQLRQPAIYMINADSIGAAKAMLGIFLERKKDIDTQYS